jgi:hypothetical protein
VNDNELCDVECDACANAFALRILNPEWSSGGLTVLARHGENGASAFAPAQHKLRHNIQLNKTRHVFD